MLNNQKCVICNNPCSGGGYKILTNGYIYHAECLHKLIYSFQEIKDRVSSLNQQLVEAETKIKESETLIYKIRSFWSGDTIDKIFYQNKVRTIISQKKVAEDEAKPINEVTTSLYDFWPETPPDWEVRKSLVRSQTGNYCQKCGKASVEKHVHHKIPVSRGGSHRLENLVYLCVNCHSRAHHGRDISTENKTISQINRPVFSDRLGLIKYAIDNNLKISFSYQKYEGGKSKRSIKPRGLKQKGQSLCVEGYCNLRNADRIFAIKRMKGVKIDGQPRKLYDY